MPTPTAARRVRPASVAKLLKKHRVRRSTAETVLEILRARPITVAPGVVKAATTSHIQKLIQLLNVVEIQISETKRDIADLVQSILADEMSSDNETPSESAPPATGRLSDAAILLSLPGIGQTVLATLLSDASGLLQARDDRGLRCLCGVAPVTRRSGQARRVVRRRVSQPRLVNAVYHWSRVAVQHDPISRARYRALHARGHTHGRAFEPSQTGSWPPPVPCSETAHSLTPRTPPPPDNRSLAIHQVGRSTHVRHFRRTVSPDVHLADPHR